MNKIAITTLALLVSANIVTAQNGDKQASLKKNYKATQISVEPVIDGILDEEVWNEGEWTDDFIQNEPYNGSKATQRTEFNVLFDNDNIYVAIKAFDSSPDSIVTRLTRRDEVDGDVVGIIFDSFHDLRTAFLFGTSSSGVKFDQVFSDDGNNEDPSWDPNWWVKTSLNSEGWIAEMKIPFSQVRFEKNSGDVWGLQVARVLYRNNETDFWQHIPKDAPGFVHLIGEMSGMEKIKPRKIFDVTPYAVGSVETFEAEPENPFLSKGSLSKLNGGIDAKIGVTNNMTLDLSINPDFGQVEADPSEVNLTAYETFFSEKRPFFIEGNNITSFGMGIGDGGQGNDNLFYSRRIGRRPQGSIDLEDGWHSKVPGNTTILGAAKLTGKTKDGLSLGFVEAMTAKELAEIDTVGGSKYVTVEPLTNYFVGRVQKDIKDGNTIIGGMLTSTNRDLEENLGDIMHKAAYTGGVDFTQYFNDKNWMFNLNYAFSHVIGSTDVITRTQQSSARYYQRPDKDYAILDTTRTSLTGTGGRMQLQKLNGHWNFMSATKWKTPGFEANDLGYVREADQVLSFIWMGYNEWNPKGIYRRFNVGNDVFGVWDFSGELLAMGYEWNANMGFKNFWNAWTGGNLQFAGKSPSLLRGGPMIKTPGNVNLRFGFSSDNRKKLGLSFYTNWSSGFMQSSESSSSELELSYKPVDFLSLSLAPGYSVSSTKLQYVRNNIKYNNDQRYIFASIDRKTVSSSVRVNLNLSPNLTFQYWGQPFISTGRYSDYKYITQPMAQNYNDRFSLYSNDQLSLNGDDFSVDENMDGRTDYSFNKKDFNVQEFLSNLVIRWEYNPGSSLYLVWSQTRSSSNESGNLHLFDDLGDLFSTADEKPHNVFLIKFSYRFGLN
ncbi:MAG TPA: DUF5916 domain-containing protein [Bacteroidales bacterium]|nr:DUF5916 domain-containing protein [Bacteroidales bacterium]